MFKSVDILSVSIRDEYNHKTLISTWLYKQANLNIDKYFFLKEVLVGEEISKQRVKKRRAVSAEAFERLPDPYWKKVKKQKKQERNKELNGQ